MKIYPVASYRLQMHSKFNFSLLSEHVEYFYRLGITHLYLSPCFQAAPGSTHGYDVVDYRQINSEIGGSYGFDRLASLLEKKKMSIILDIVPNHMAVRCPENPWWWDVLENGQSSQFSRYFDVDWHTDSNVRSNLILLPVLGDHYGIVLENLELQIKCQSGKFTLNYFDNILPLAPRSIAMIMDLAYQKTHIRELGFLADSLQHLSEASSRDVEKIARRQRDKAVLFDMIKDMCLKQADCDKALCEAVDEINKCPELLDKLTGKQNYKLAHWKLSRYQVGYRRFFNINTLVGLRMEDKYTFSDSHELVIELAKSGKIDGLRIDHPDGLFEPAVYFKRLRKACPEMLILAEKILERDENLNSAWPVSGTTGYDFLNIANGLFIDNEGYQKICGIWREFTGESQEYCELAYQNKRKVIKNLLGSEVSRLASDLSDICENHRRYRDFANQELFNAIVEVTAGMEVYRTYIEPETGIVSENEKLIIEKAINNAKLRQPEMGSYVFDFIAEILLLNLRGSHEDFFIKRFQQFTGPVMAKSIEDTLFYTFIPLISANEVGGNPFSPCTSVEKFHEWCLYISKNWPLTMLASSTHDTKRSEDVRARLNVLSEMPEQWEKEVNNWKKLNGNKKKSNLPDANTEYFLYQTLVGAWPIEKTRLKPHMEKAVREAKVFSSWQNPDKTYEQALMCFIDDIYENEEFISSLRKFVVEISGAGYQNSLRQLTLKLTAPGFPDIYQGTEVWNNSLTDPDNRRPVDLEQSLLALKETENMSLHEILNEMKKGLPKIFVMQKILQLRSKIPAFNEPDSYTPITVHGLKAEKVLAYMRGKSVIVVIPRLQSDNRNNWSGARINMPDGKWIDIFSGKVAGSGAVKIKDLLQEFPVAVLLDHDQVDLNS